MFFLQISLVSTLVLPFVFTLAFVPCSLLCSPLFFLCSHCVPCVPRCVPSCPPSYVLLLCSPDWCFLCSSLCYIMCSPLCSLPVCPLACSPMCPPGVPLLSLPLCSLPVSSCVPPMCPPSHLAFPLVCPPVFSLCYFCSPVCSPLCP